MSQGNDTDLGCHFGFMTNSSEIEKSQFVDSCWWTRNYSIDRLKQELGTIVHQIRTSEGEIAESSKYYDQAYDLLKIGAFKPASYFIIYLSDLSPRLIKELYNLEIVNREFVLKQAVGRIFE